MSLGECTFENSVWVLRLPVHLAQRIIELNTEISLRGEHTTANKTVAVIETTFGYLGRLWVAEYVHAGAADTAINQDLLHLSRRPVLTGHWVSLARRIRDLFVRQSMPTVVADLAELDFGEQDDPEHPVTRLIAYRNSFSHGSMATVVADIRAHRRLIEQLLTGIPALRDQPIHCYTEEDGLPRLALQGWPRAMAMPQHLEPCYQPFIVGAGGTIHLRLYPLLYAAPTDKGMVLHTGESKSRQHPLGTLFERETLRLWYGRYRREQNGHLAFDDTLRARAQADLPPTVSAAVRHALAAPGVARVIAEAYPGCGKVGLITQLESIAPPADRVATAAYVVESGGLSKSGLTFARFLLRRTEAALNLDDDACFSVDDQLSVAIDKAEESLSAAGVILLVGVEDLHHGLSPYQEESLSVAEVFAMPSGRAIRLLGTVHPGMPGRFIACDRRILVPVPESSKIALDELRAVTMELCPPGDSLGRRSLLALLQAQRPLTLFGLCDALEKDGDTVFEPAVEQTLWRLRPLLLVDGSGSELRWQPLRGLCRSWLGQGD